MSLGKDKYYKYHLEGGSSNDGEAEEEQINYNGKHGKYVYTKK
jgi:hypothetical protein